MEDLKEILVKLKKILKDEKMNDISQDMCLDCSTRIYISNMIQKHKNCDSGDSNKELASDKQKYWMNQRGIEFDENITKQEAFQIIKENS